MQGGSAEADSDEEQGSFEQLCPICGTFHPPDQPPDTGMTRKVNEIRVK